jgi:hypothetical protein
VGPVGLELPVGDLREFPDSSVVQPHGEHEQVGGPGLNCGDAGEVLGAADG